MVQEAKKKTVHWKAPGDWGRHQLDYILIKHQFRNSVKDVQTLPVADIDSDHNLLVAKSPHQVEENYKIPKEQT